MKRYLSGIDWAMNSLDHAAKARSGIGHISQVVLELDGEIDSAVLRRALYGFLRQFPLLGGRARRDLNLCPYWKVPDKKLIPHPRLSMIRAPEEPGVLPPLEAQINTPFPAEWEHLSFTLLRSGARNFLAMTFDHRILDARGAETLLDYFQRYYQKNGFPDVRQAEPPHLDHWKEKFQAGRKVNRMFLSLTREASRSFPVSWKSRVCKLKIAHLAPAQADLFVENAYAQAGYLMLMPYALARSVQVMHRIFAARHIPGRVYLIPVSIDARLPEKSGEQLFFNHLSFLFFKIEADKVHDFALLLASIKEQMYAQVKNGLPEALTQASLLLRIVPLPLTDFFMKISSRKILPAFAFSFVNSAYSGDGFMGRGVRNIFHLPRVPNPPGVGIFLNQFKGRINLTLSYLEGVLSEEEAQGILRELQDTGHEQ
ncbi:MAG: hypothetical protein WC552_01380 [Candidatus Omnitrophota bacterium]